MKILVTGASGFIGAYLIDALIKIYGRSSVFAFSTDNIANVNCIIYNRPRDFKVQASDFSDFTCLIHAGAFIPKDTSQANDISRCNDNVFFTENLLSLDLRGLKRIIFLSTVDVYDCSGVVSEETRIQPVSLYGASKFYCEELIRAFAKNNAVEYMNLRVGHVYGAGEEKYRKVLPVAIGRILAGRPVEVWGSGSELRSFIYVKDVVKAIVNSVECKIANLNVNVVSGIPISIRDLLVRLISISGKDVALNYIESNHSRRDLIFDNSKLISMLLDRETDLENGLFEEYSYMKKKYENNI